MKKIIMIILLIVLLVGCSSKGEQLSDSLKFKEEYESLNDEKNENNGKKYRTLNIDGDNSFVYKEASDIVDMMDNKETFVVYFGFASCPWCRSIILPLIKVTNDLEIYRVYYVDVKEIRDTMTIDENGEIIIEKKGTDDYYQLMERLDSVLENYMLTDQNGNEVDTGKKRIYAPNIVAVVAGEVKEMTDGISGKQTDAYMELTSDMVQESYDKIKCSIECVADNKKVCSLKTKC